MLTLKRWRSFAPVWIFHFISLIGFGTLGSLAGVSFPTVLLLYSFLWGFFCLQHFFVEPMHFGVWTYTRHELAGKTHAWLIRLVCGQVFWYVLLVIPFFWAWGLGKSPWIWASLTFFVLGYQSMICALGPLVAHDRQANWFFIVFLVPLSMPLLMMFWQTLTEPDLVAPRKLLAAVSLLYMLIAYFLFSWTAGSVDDV